MAKLRIDGNEIEVPDHFTLLQACDILGLDVIMDHGWITTFGAAQSMNVQLSIASKGVGTKVPDVSIEVDDLDAAFEAMSASGFPIEYGPADEPYAPIQSDRASLAHPVGRAAL